MFNTVLNTRNVIRHFIRKENFGLEHDLGFACNFCIEFKFWRGKLWQGGFRWIEFANQGDNAGSFGFVQVGKLEHAPRRKQGGEGIQCLGQIEELQREFDAQLARRCIDTVSQRSYSELYSLAREQDRNNEHQIVRRQPLVRHLFDQFAPKIDGIQEVAPVNQTLNLEYHDGGGGFGLSAGEGEVPQQAGYLGIAGGAFGLGAYQPVSAVDVANVSRDEGFVDAGSLTARTNLAVEFGAEIGGFEIKPAQRHPRQQSEAEPTGHSRDRKIVAHADRVEPERES
ncbi:MAG: hypothetical protein IH881_12245 [Myxococcales bacterium]|nr:hypothetical protein [Myxococcales bacterium]